VNKGTGLERRYRRLLAGYPRAFRRLNEEEMIAVLLAGARPGQYRPGLAEGLNLIMTGLCVRMRRRRLIARVAPFAAALAVLGYILSAASGSYSATAAVVVTQPSDGHSYTVSPRTSGSVVNLDVQAQIVASGTVAALVARMMHTSMTPYQLSKEVTVKVPPNSILLDITCHTSSAPTAATCANDFALAYLQNRKSTAIARLTWQLSSLAARTGRVLTAVAGLDRQIGSLPSSSPARAVDKTKLAADQSQLSQLQRQVSELTGEQASTSVGAIITEATAKPHSG
jgi:uncharacterized protein involved in exopolysaccharide biosynthesis